MRSPAKRTRTLFGGRCRGRGLGILLLRRGVVRVGEDGVEAGLHSGHGLGEERAPSTRGRHCLETERDVWQVDNAMWPCIEQGLHVGRASAPTVTSELAGRCAIGSCVAVRVRAGIVGSSVAFSSFFLFPFFSSFVASPWIAK